MKLLTDFDVANKKVILRCDFNVPIDENGTVLDDFRIREALPTIQYLISQKAKVILLAHLGSPEKIEERFKLKVIKDMLEKLLGLEIKKTNDCLGLEVQNAVENLKSGEVLLLENVRFHKEEKENNADFAKQLASLADIYINDAFDVCHRSHASVVGVPQFLPHGAGLLLQKELANLDKILKNPKRPLLALIGGIKVEDKANFIENMVHVADNILVSGLIKKEMDKSPVLAKVSAWQEKIIAPAGDFEALDINEETIKLFSKKIFSAKTIIWNGPFGKCEDLNYTAGTLAVANAIIKSGAFSVVGGGQTVAFLQKENLIDKFGWVSTGGGAMLSYVAGERLPGLEALK